ncbi:hypothetical protein HMPREF9946_03405 [Acetobacteraceae bacterium AT-5844]|nr:hypothetical protein HMPREF9946_03405 [Acetobacteraceae bacterium AT-5844]
MPLPSTGRQASASVSARRRMGIALPRLGMAREAAAACGVRWRNDRGGAPRRSGGGRIALHRMAS